MLSMLRFRSRSWLPFVLLAAGCGPEISERRLGFYPARDPRCALEFVAPDPRATAPGGPLEIVGYITISEKRVEDPFSEKYRKIVGPRACRMGGEAITILHSASSESGARSGSGTTWGVLRYRRAPGALGPAPY